MKKEIHPKYHTGGKIICVCGKTYITGSTVPEIHVEVCSNCHPFYTGKQKLVDSAGMVDRFKKKYKEVKISTARVKKIKKTLKKQPKQIKKTLSSTPKKEKTPAAPAKAKEPESKKESK